MTTFLAKKYASFSPNFYTFTCGTSLFCKKQGSHERSEELFFGPKVEIHPKGLKRAAERSGECGALKISRTRTEKITARSGLHAHVIVSKLRTRAFKCAPHPKGAGAHTHARPNEVRFPRTEGAVYEPGSEADRALRKRKINPAP